MGSEDGGTYETIRELEPNAKFLEGLPIEMSDAEKGVTAADKDGLVNYRYEEE